MKTITLLTATYVMMALAQPMFAQERAGSESTYPTRAQENAAAQSNFPAESRDNHETDKHWKTIQFRGTLTAAENFRYAGDPPFGFFVDGLGTANSTNLGSFTWYYSDLVAFSDVAPATTPGRARFIAPNGDNIFSCHSAVQIPTSDPNVTNIVETHVITGGTGRYADAQGSFVIKRVITVENQEVLNGTTAGTFKGTITVRSGH